MYTQIVWCPLSRFSFTTAGFYGKVLQILICTSLRVWDLDIQEIVRVIQIGAYIKLHRTYWEDSSSEWSWNLKIISGTAVLSSCLIMDTGSLLGLSFVQWRSEIENRRLYIVVLFVVSKQSLCRDWLAHRANTVPTALGQGKGCCMNLNVCASVDPKTCVVSRLIWIWQVSDTLFAY